MMRSVAVLGIAMAAVVLGAHAAFAQSAGEICIFGICIPIGLPGGGGHPAPAPLLAAGIPAFTALGGGVLVARVIRKFRARA
jgi:hypothetical protein